MRRKNQSKLPDRMHLDSRGSLSELGPTTGTIQRRFSPRAFYQAPGAAELLRAGGQLTKLSSRYGYTKC